MPPKAKEKSTAAEDAKKDDQGTAVTKIQKKADPKAGPKSKLKTDPNDKKPTRPPRYARPTTRPIIMIDPITGKETPTKLPEALVQTKREVPDVAKTQGGKRPNVPSRKPPTKEDIDVCLNVEKNKPWIKGYHGTLIQLAPGEKENKLFTSLVTKQSKEWDGWWIPSEQYYKIICKDYGMYLTSQAGSQLTIRRDGAATAYSDKDEASTVVLVGNIIAQQITTKDGKIKLEETLIHENNEYKTARANYFQRLMKSSEQEVSELLFKKVSDLTAPDWKALHNVIDKYLEQFGPKLGTKGGTIKLDTLLKFLVQKARETNTTIKILLTNIVKSTIFLRNEFNVVNENLIGKLKKGIIDVKQLATMTNEELLPEVFLNPQLDIQVVREELMRKIKEMIESTVYNLATNICINYKNDIIHGWQPTRKEIKPDIIPPVHLNVVNNLYSLLDLVPLENLCAVRAARAEGNHLSEDDMDKLRELVFYKDADGNIFCYNLGEIKQIIDSKSTINPITGQPFLPEFLTSIKKLNLSHLPSEYDVINNQLAEEIDPNFEDQDEELSSKLNVTDGTDLEGALMVAKTDAGSASTKAQESVKLVGTDFWDFVTDIVRKLEAQNIQHFSFDNDNNDDVKEKCKIHYCFGCSKRLTKENEWSRTINLDKKSGNYINNVYHIGCMYNSPFKI